MKLVCGPESATAEPEVAAVNWKKQLSAIYFGDTTK
jgi:hypothetical protein